MLAGFREFLSFFSEWREFSESDPIQLARVPETAELVEIGNQVIDALQRNRGDRIDAAVQKRFEELRDTVADTRTVTDANKKGLFAAFKNLSISLAKRIAQKVGEKSADAVAVEIFTSLARLRPYWGQIWEAIKPHIGF